jgi:hypothetical protein
MSPTAYLESKPFKTLSLKLYKYAQFIPHREQFPFPLQRHIGDSYETQIQVFIFNVLLAVRHSISV